MYFGVIVELESYVELPTCTCTHLFVNEMKYYITLLAYYRYM